jgi:hypothetical protein
MKTNDPYWHIGFDRMTVEDFIDVLDRSGLTLPALAERLHVPFGLVLGWATEGIDEPWEVAVVRAFDRTGIVVPPVDWLDAAIVRSGLGWGSCFQRMAKVTRVPLAVLHRHSRVGAPGNTHGRIYALMACEEYRKAASRLGEPSPTPAKLEERFRYQLPARKGRYMSLPAPVLAEIFSQVPADWSLIHAAELRLMIRQGVLPRDMAAHYGLTVSAVKQRARRRHVSWLEREVPVVWDKSLPENLPTPELVLFETGVACDAYPNGWMYE